MKCDLIGLLEMRRLIQGNLVFLQCRQCISIFRAQELPPALPDLPKERSGSNIIVGEVLEKVCQIELCFEGQQICRSQLPAAQVKCPLQIDISVRLPP